MLDVLTLACTPLPDEGPGVVAAAAAVAALWPACGAGELPPWACACAEGERGAAAAVLLTGPGVEIVLTGAGAVGAAEGVSDGAVGPAVDGAGAVVMTPLAPVGTGVAARIPVAECVEAIV